MSALMNIDQGDKSLGSKASKGGAAGGEGEGSVADVSECTPEGATGAAAAAGRLGSAPPDVGDDAFVSVEALSRIGAAADDACGVSAFGWGFCANTGVSTKISIVTTTSMAPLLALVGLDAAK
jgi:hypothetical protein